jgi:hypothetical protein
VSSIDSFNTCDLVILADAGLFFANCSCSSSIAVIWREKKIYAKHHKQDNIVKRNISIGLDNI